MKEKILNFIKEKKELLIFLGIVLVVFTAVIIIAQASSKKTENVAKTPIVTKDDNIPPNTSEQPPVTVIEKMIRPLYEDDFDITREFFDENSILAVDAVINDHGNFYESYGISYSTLDNTAFNVVSIFSGKVTNVENNEKHNSIVTITHKDGLVSKYYSLEDVTVKIGDELLQGEKIGKASASSYDNEAGVHVHLEVFINENRINPTECVNKTISEIIELD